MADVAAPGRLASGLWPAGRHSALVNAGGVQQAAYLAWNPHISGLGLVRCA